MQIYEINPKHKVAVLQRLECPLKMAQNHPAVVRSVMCSVALWKSGLKHIP